MADEVRLIDKDKLIKKINAEIDAWAKSRMCMTADELLETIEEFEEEAEPDNGWISVKDRLPEIKEEHYRSELVMCYSPDGEHECLFDYYEINGFGQGCFTTEKYFGITITHWQHLPEPPKGE